MSLGCHLVLPLLLYQQVIFFSVCFSCSLKLLPLLSSLSVANLAQPGTFAGNDAIVAFARNNQMNVVIHQLNAPLWQVSLCGQGTVHLLSAMAAIMCPHEDLS